MLIVNIVKYIMGRHVCQIKERPGAPALILRGRETLRRAFRWSGQRFAGLGRFPYQLAGVLQVLHFFEIYPADKGTVPSLKFG